MAKENTTREFANDDVSEGGLATELMEQYPKSTAGYEIRQLRDGDTYRVAGMLSKVLGDENLRWAGTAGDQTMLMLAGVAALFEHAPREIQLFCANLIGVEGGREHHKREDEERQAKEIKARREWMRERTEAESKGKEALEEFDRENPEPMVYQLKNTKEIDRLVEDEILAKFETYPPGTSQDIIAEVMERDDFLPFVTSSMRVYEAGKKLSGRFSTLSSKLSGSQS